MNSADRTDGRPLAVVTGAGGGIGRATAMRLAREGYEVVVSDRDPATAAETCRQITHEGHAARSFTGDLTVPESRTALARAAAGAEVLVNNAGIFERKPFEDLVDLDFRRLIDINVIALFGLCQALATSMPRGGRIVNLASRASLGARGYAHYVASKSAVVGLTRALALELAPCGLLVNAVAPGVIDTSMTAFLDPTARARIASGLPSGRIGTPEDVAAAVAFLASREVGFITGQVLLVDGGSSVGGLSPG